MAKVANGRRKFDKKMNLANIMQKPKTALNEEEISRVKPDAFWLPISGERRRLHPLAFAGQVVGRGANRHGAHRGAMRTEG